MWQAIIAMVLTALSVFGLILAQPQDDDVFATDLIVAPEMSEAQEWAEFNELARIEYEDLFTALFEATEVKWSKNGRLMVKGAEMTSFKFARRS